MLGVSTRVRCAERAEEYAEYSHAYSGSVSRVSMGVPPWGAQSTDTGEMRRWCRVVCYPICACHSAGGCTGDRGRARRGRRQERGASTEAGRADEGPCTSCRRSHHSRRARWLGQTRAGAAQVGSSHVRTWPHENGRLHSGARVARPQRPRAPMWPLRVRSHSHYPSVSTQSTRRGCTAPERIPRAPCAAVSHVCHEGRCKLLRGKPHATTALHQAKRSAAARC